MYKDEMIIEGSILMIYISTGGFKNMTPTESIKYFNKNGINNIELSGGKYEEKYMKN